MVVLESVIQTNALGRWYIELSDTMKEESVEDNLMICLDIHEYAEKIELMGKEYDGEVEVAWSSGEGVTVEQINEVRQQIMTYEAEVEAKNSETTHMPDGTPNFSV